MVTLVLGAVAKVATSLPLGVVPVDQLAPLFQSSVVPIQVASAPSAGSAGTQPRGCGRPQQDRAQHLTTNLCADAHATPPDRAPCTRRCRRGYTKPNRHELYIFDRI